MIDKEQAKKEFNTKTQMIIIAIVVFCVSVILFSVIAWFLKLLDTKEDGSDPKNAPAAARNYMNDTSIDGNGNIVLGKSIAEWWEELKNSGNKITKYLNSAEELAKLMNAAMALEYPDTRENPDDPIVWEDIDINSKEIQGIVKFKRALKDGGKPISMTYVPPSEFQQLISKYNNAKSDDERENAKNEALKHFTMEKTTSSSNNVSTGGSPIVEEALKYACSWVGKVPYKSHINGYGDNNERSLPLQEGRASDCSHFVHWVFEHVGLMDKDNFIHSLEWGNGGDDGGCPGTVKIGTDLSQASPGDVLWWHGSSGKSYDNHVSIYLGNNQVVECGDPDGVKISKVSKFHQILHFTSLPTDPTGYFDPNTMTLHSSLSYNNADIAKVSSLQGMVFMGDSILSAIRARTSLEKGEGAITMYQSGCSAEFFLGEQDCTDNSDTNCRDGRYFDWNKQFSKIKNPTGFYLMLGQNFFEDKSHRIDRMDRLVQKIRSQYPNAPIYISSVLRYLKRNDSNRTREVKEATLAMNEELKIYCLNNSNNNVFYSDVLKGYDESDEMLINHTVDDDHPNEEGAKILLKNIKANIVSQNYLDISNDEEILKITAIDFMAIPNDGWGDGIMLTSNGYHLLMDTFSSLCKESLYKYLRDNNINEFDIYISHNHGDHHGNLMSLINDYKVSKVYLPNLSSFDKSAKDIEEKGIRVIRLKEGDTFEIGSSNCVGEVLFGPESFEECKNDVSKLINNQSLVTMIRAKTRIGDVKYLTGGDIEDVAANKILERGIDIGADIMKADHHGGGDTPEYVKRVNPSFYIIDLLRPYDDWVQPQVDAAEECGNVFSTYNNGEISFSIKASGNIVPTAQRNVEQVKFNVQDASGKTYIVTYTLNKESSHIITDQMKRAVTNEAIVSTLNSTYKVKVATWSERQESVVSDDPAVTDYDTGVIPNMTTTTIPYQEIVSKYKMPFNYLWTMLVYSQDKDYTFDLADLVKDSKIEITIHDNFTETTNIVVDKYTNYKKAYTTATADVYYRYKYIDTERIIDKTTLIPEQKDIVRESSGILPDRKVVGEHEDTPEYTTTHTTINRNNTLDIALTLADSWFVKYTKSYKYNKLKESPPYENTVYPKDIVNDPEYAYGDFGGNKNELIHNAIKQIDESWIVGEPNVEFHDDVVTEYTTKVINRSTYTKNIVKSSSYVASVPGSSGSGSSGYSSSVSNVSTGNLTTDSNSALRPTPQGSGTHRQQGFCFAGDDFIVYGLNHSESPEDSSIYLVDLNDIKKKCYEINGIKDHTNSLAYDSKTGDVIVPENSMMRLYHVNKTTKELENERIVKMPLYADSSQIAYNETHDLFISKEHVYTREAFYSGGKAIRDIDYKPINNNHLMAGCTSYGNHVYYFFTESAHNTKSYFLVYNILTGKQEEIIHDSLTWEAEEASFKSDGTLYTMYGTKGSALFRTTYNYFQDTNIDTKNVTPGSSTTVNNIARYNTGGEYDKKNGFAKVVRVLNSHYNARSNILSVTEWLFKAMAQNSDTEKMIDITQYFLHKATGNDYGEYGNKEFDYEAYIQDGFTDIAESGGKSGIDGIQGQIYDYLLAKGVPAVGAAAILGNIQSETAGTWDPSVVNPIGAAGLCQWYQGRLETLKKQAASKGKNWTDVDCQLDYLWEELNTKYTKVRDVIMSADQESELEYATWYWGRYFEIFFLGDSFEASKDMTASRYKNAQHWYQEWQQHHTVGSGGAGVINPGGITTQEEANRLTEQYNQMLNTKVHDGDSQYQQGPFPKYWSNPYNVLSKFQCTWWANGRASMYLEQYGTKYKKYPTQMGNGGEYYDINRKNGYFNYGSTPKVNSLVSMPSASSYGHVAYVEGVTSEGIWISDAGSGKSWRGVRFRKFSELNVYGYIYLDEPK